MRRGYPLSVFEQAVYSLHAIGVQIITHVILFLPGESEADMLATIHYLNALPIDGIKLQLLHVLNIPIWQIFTGRNLFIFQI